MKNFANILKLSGWDNFTKTEQQALLKRLQEAKDEKREIVTFKGSVIMLPFGVQVLKHYGLKLKP